MNLSELHTKLITSFGLEKLSGDDQNSMLLEILKTIQKQFLLDVYDFLGKEKFDALQKSAEMGDQFYETTLKHLVPNHETLLDGALEKVIAAFQKGS